VGCGGTTAGFRPQQEPANDTYSAPSAACGIPGTAGTYTPYNRPGTSRQAPAASSAPHSVYTVSGINRSVGRRTRTPPATTSFSKPSRLCPTKVRRNVRGVSGVTTLSPPMIAARLSESVTRGCGRIDPDAPHM